MSRSDILRRREGAGVEGEEGRAHHLPLGPFLLYSLLAFEKNCTIGITEPHDIT